MRFLHNHDLSSILEIEEQNFEHPWVREDFISILRKRETTMMVSEIDNKIMGYMIYELYKNHINLIRLVVPPECRRHGIGSALVNKIISKLSTCRRNHIELEIDDDNLAVHLFLKSLGFHATNILHLEFGDVYCFSYYIDDHIG